MGRIVLAIVCLAFILLPASGCAGGQEAAIEAGLEETFLLPAGEEAVITDEDMKIRFEEVIEDSRCPRSVECVWAGQAKYALLFTLEDDSERAVLTEPGAYGQTQINVLDYVVKASLEPYPEEPDDINEGDYRLCMTVSKVPASTMGLEDRADIYAAVIKRLYTSDHSFGSNPPDFPNLYLIYVTDDRAGADMQEPAASRLLTGPLRGAIEERLSDLPAKIYWVGSFAEVPLVNNSSVKGGGAVVNVGNIHEQDGAVQVSGSIYVANLAASGRTYILEEHDGAWRITGDTGVIWVS